MNAFLESLQASAFAEWVLVSTWGYPILLTVHSLGLALLAGILMTIDLRVLGIARTIPLPPFRSLMAVVWFGFAINLLSGLAIFMSDAVKYFYSNTFRVKLLFIVVGLVLAAMLNSSAMSAARGANRGEANEASSAKVIAALSLVAWLGAITAGRLMAYV